MDPLDEKRISGWTVFERAEEPVYLGFCQERKDKIWFKTQGKCRYQLNLYSAFVITTEKHVGMFPCNEKE